MSSVLTRRRALLGTAALSLTSGLLLPDSALACHDYRGPSGTGCGAYRADQSSGSSSSSSDNTSTQQAASPSSSSSSEPRVNGRTVRVSSGPQLQQALDSVGPGTTIECANGEYRGRFRITTNGTSSNKIMITSSSRLGAVLRDRLEVMGNHVIVSGLTIHGARLDIQAVDCRVTRCLIRNGAGISAAGANRIEIDYCELRDWSGRGIDINPLSGGRTGTQPYIHHNYCHSGKGWAIAVGQQDRHHTHAVDARVAFNLIEGADAIYLKSSRNRISDNTVTNGGYVKTRFGRNNSFINNWLENSAGLGLRDIGNIAQGNKLVRCRQGLVVFAGNVASSEAFNGRVSRPYPFADNCQLIENDANRTVIGLTYSDFRPLRNATGTVVRGHRGNISYSAHSGTRVASTGQASSASRARKLSRSQVGPNGRG